MEKTKKKLLFTIVALLSANVTMHFFGAGIFMLIEKNSETSFPSFENGTLLKNQLEAILKRNLSKAEYVEIAKLLQPNEIIEPMVAWKREISWDTFERWLCFVAVTVSTIGYGNITPESDGSKIFLMPFALVAIPLNLCCLAFIGRFIGVLLRSLIEYVERHLLKREKVTRLGFKSLMLLFLVMWLWLFFGALATLIITKWEFLDCVYFMFVSYTTIGYGDFIVGRASNPTYDGLMILHSMFGLTLVAGVLDGIRAILMNDRITNGNQGKVVNMDDHELAPKVKSSFDNSRYDF